MKRRHVWKTLLVLVGVAACSTRAAAFLGIGDIVFDPSVYAQAVQQVIQLEQQYAQLVQTYQMVRNQYNQLLWMAQQVPVDMRARYRVLASPAQLASAANVSGTTADWIAALNTTGRAITGYTRATEPLDSYGSTLAVLPADQQTRVRTSFGTVELADGAAIGAMETLGALHAKMPATLSAIQRLEDDSLSSDPRMNTEVAVLNKISAAQVIGLRSSLDANQLLGSIGQQQLVDAKRLRDAEARGIHQHIQFLRNGRAALSAQASGASDAMLAWRMP